MPKKEQPLYKKSRNGIDRRSLIVGTGTAAIGLGLIYVIFGGQIIKDQSQPTDTEILALEAKRLNIISSAEEANIWLSAYPDPNHSPKYPLNEITVNEGKKRLKTIVQLMQKSKNPHFVHAGQVLEPLINTGTIAVNFYPSLKDEKHEGIFGASTRLKDDKLQIDLGVSLDAVLNQFDPTLAAIALTHEADHIERMVAFQKGLPSNLSVQDRYNKEKERLQTGEAKALDEALAYGKQSQAYIYQYGLGYRNKNSYQDDAASFVRLGNNANSAQWQQYVRTKILRW